MYTYQDLVAAGNDKMDFVRTAISDHKGTSIYQTAKIADLYNRHKNVTINQYQRILYTVTGKAVPDNWSPNFKMACRHFHRFIIQEVQHLLGNGTSWGKNDTGNKLGNDRYPWDNQLQELAKMALIGSVAFGFFNLDHIDVFSVLEFVPLYDEENGALMAGIRFWQIAEDKPLRATLYEIDGYTDYIWHGGRGEILNEKRPYKIKARYSEAWGVEIYDGENYPSLPIVPLWANDEHQSEIVGLREQIDCYDLIKSGFANTVDEASIVYWTIQNAGGMDDIDLVKFVERIKTMHAAAVGEDGQGATAQSHQQEAPYASREALLDRLDKDLYRDAMALNTETIAGGAITATQIKAAYEPLNSKVDDFEYCVLDFVKGILAVAGIDDEATFERSSMVNVSEEVTSIIQSANYLPDDYITKKLLVLFGDADITDKVLRQMSADELEHGSDLDSVDNEEGETDEDQ